MNTFVLYVAAVLSLTPTPLDIELQACYPPRQVAMIRYQEACDHRNWLQDVKDAGVDWPGWQDEYDQASKLNHFHDYLTEAMAIDRTDEERKDFLQRARTIAIEMGYPANTWLPATPER